MHPNLEEIKADLARVRAQLTTLVEQTPAAKFEHHPKSGGWTGTGIIQHLGKVEGSATKLLEGLFAKALADGMALETKTVSWVGTIARFNVQDRTRKINAPERLYPEAAPDLTASWESLQAVRGRLHRAMESVDGRDLTVVSHPHPIFGPLNGYEWIAMVGQHEERHLTQLRETLSEASSDANRSISSNCGEHCSSSKVTPAS
jgi:hypothetical protein